VTGADTAEKVISLTSRLGLLLTDIRLRLSLDYTVPIHLNFQHRRIKISMHLGLPGTLKRRFGGCGGGEKKRDIFDTVRSRVDKATSPEGSQDEFEPPLRN